jgi:hypothetical protein
MTSSNINHNALKHLIEANSVKLAKAIAEGDIWTLRIIAGDTEKVVMAKNSGEPRIWRKLDTLTKYLKGLGLDYFEIDASEFNPAQKTLLRPDSAATLKRTHEAHKKAQKLIKPPNAHESLSFLDDGIQSEKVVKEKWEERRAKILKQEDPRAK